MYEYENVIYSYIIYFLPCRENIPCLTKTKEILFSEVIGFAERLIRIHTYTVLENADFLCR